MYINTENVSEQIVLTGRFAEKIECNPNASYKHIKIIKKEGTSMYISVEDIFKIANLYNMFAKVKEINNEFNKNKYK